jgi:hypothetical protein
VEWDNSTGKYGVKTTKNLPNRFCIPVGGLFEVSEEERVKLFAKGGDWADFLIEYDCLMDQLTNKKRILATKRKESQYIIIDVNPRFEQLYNFPEDSWIGSRVNSAPTGAKWNCHFEIIGVEHSEERRYPFIKYNLFIVLDNDVPVNSWLYRPVMEKGRNVLTRTIKANNIEAKMEDDGKDDVAVGTVLLLVLFDSSN